MASSPEGIVDKNKMVVIHGKWRSQEDDNKVVIGADPGLHWEVDVRVLGERDSECALLKFGFVQCVTRFNVHVKRSKSCLQYQHPVMPWWDVARGQENGAFWYLATNVQSVDACFNPSSRNQEDKVAHVKFDHIDFPSITEPWRNPPSDKNSLLTELVYDATFVTTLVEKSPSKAPRALVYLQWSVEMRVEFDFDKKLGKRTRFLRNVVDARPEAVTMGGAPGVALVNKNIGEVTRVPCH